MPRRRDDTRCSVSMNGGPEIDVTEALAAQERHDELSSYVERLERLHVEKAEIADQIKDVLGVAEKAGFSKKALAEVVKRRLQTADQAAERRAIEDEVERMEAALGVFVTTPLGRAAIDRVAAEAAH